MHENTLFELCSVQTRCKLSPISLHHEWFNRAVAEGTKDLRSPQRRHPAPPSWWWQVIHIPHNKGVKHPPALSPPLGSRRAPSCCVAFNPQIFARHVNSLTECILIHDPSWNHAEGKHSMAKQRTRKATKRTGRINNNKRKLALSVGEMANKERAEKKPHV